MKEDGKWAVQELLGKYRWCRLRQAGKEDFPLQIRVGKSRPSWQSL